MVLSLAGLDPGGGAGLIADVKAIEAHGCWAAAVATALTVQTVGRVREVHAVPALLLGDQIDAVFEDLPVAAVKIGMLPDAPAIDAVADALRERQVPVVLDPVCASTSGRRFLDDAALDRLRKALLPLVTVLTPNRSEAGIVCGAPGSAADEAAQRLLALGAGHVLVSGGPGRAGRCVDRLYARSACHEIVHRSFETDRVHGTGCLHAASVAARLARGEGVLDAARSAAAWIEGAVEHAVAFGGGGAPDAAWGVR